MKTFITAAITLSCMSSLASAAVIANYDFEDYASGSTGNDATITSDTDPLLGAYNDRVYDAASTFVLPVGINSVSTISFGVNGVTNGQNKVETTYSSQVFRWRMHNADTAGDPNPLEAFFTVDIASGYELSNFSLSLDMASFGVPPTATFDLLYDAGSGFQTMTASGLSLVDADSGTIDPFTSDTIASTVTGTVVFKIDVSTGGANDTSWWDSIQVNGDIAAVPEPSAFALIGAFGLLALIRRRRA